MDFKEKKPKYRDLWYGDVNSLLEKPAPEQKLVRRSFGAVTPSVTCTLTHLTLLFKFFSMGSAEIRSSELTVP